MKMTELQTGFFGYRKDSVYRLVASMEEGFSAQLLEKDAQHERKMQEAQDKIEKLEKELQAAREKELSSRRDRDVISGTQLNAQAYAQKLREDSLSQEQELQAKLQEETQRQSAMLESYARQIRQVRDAILTLMQTLDEHVQKVQTQVAATADRAPEPELNLSLFLKKTGTEE